MYLKFRKVGHVLKNISWTHVQSMAGRVYVTDQDAEEPEDFIVGLTTQVCVMSVSFFKACSIFFLHELN